MKMFGSLTLIHLYVRYGYETIICTVYVDIYSFYEFWITHLSLFYRFIGQPISLANISLIM